jgi:hypothetical protein
MLIMLMMPFSAVVVAVVDVFVDVAVVVVAVAVVVDENDVVAAVLDDVDLNIPLVEETALLLAEAGTISIMLDSLEYLGVTMHHGFV